MSVSVCAGAGGGERERDLPRKDFAYFSSSSDFRIARADEPTPVVVVVEVSAMKEGAET